MKLWKYFGDILYPRRCAFCDSALERGERFLCADCRMHAEPRLHLFGDGFAPFAYRGQEKGAVLRMKYAERPEYAAFFAAAILYVGRSLLTRWAPEAVVPVPIHRRRLARRGFNQAEEMARRIAAELCLPLRTDLLLRRKHTKPQRGLGRKERAENLREAFVCRADSRIPQKILLVDDIYTSGATIREASDALRAAGAEEVRTICATVV